MFVMRRSLGDENGYAIMLREYFLNIVGIIIDFSVFPTCTVISGLALSYIIFCKDRCVCFRVSKSFVWRNSTRISNVDRYSRYGFEGCFAKIFGCFVKRYFLYVMKPVINIAAPAPPRISPVRDI
ncbi:MAG: hypothetical protein Hyperionvirus4_114 [Hyperionvirus sp.]|uniref:Uncharacterized protein n=1 Tax=Hyperionvirus sp. TaxID=2487770 RepID=A0A3G5ACS6_9VIRU|nr:MAG: hypothetical protein Hyperionvirus4_114 [Hyperionvirus sp.]